MLATMEATSSPGTVERHYGKGRRVLSAGLVTTRREGSAWIVRSESGNGSYSVRRSLRGWTCSCKGFSIPDYCKHVAACQLLVGETPSSVDIIRPRKTYPQNWAAYDLGQTQEFALVQRLLTELAASVNEPPRLQGRGGRPPVPLQDQITATILKVWAGKSGRRSSGFWESAAREGHLHSTIGRMTVQRLLGRKDMTPVLNNLVTLSALPLAGLEEGGAVAPDSTGVQTTSFGAWMETKHGDRRVRHWLKVHAMIGTRTHVIIRAVVGEENSGDAPQFAPLLRWTIEAGFHPSDVVADKGYLSRDNYTLATELGVGAYIPFKSNSVARIRSQASPSAWRKAYHLFQASREEFDRKYHQRSNVESVFSALKRKFGENIRSRTPVAQVNEVLCKLIAYNLTVVVHEMYEHGIAPSFSSPPPMAKDNEPKGTEGTAP